MASSVEPNQALTVVITGANVGIGLATTLRLVELGHDVIATVRDETKGEFVIAQATAAARKVNKEPKIQFMILDTSDMKSVRTFVENFKKLDKKPHVLINNAGLMMGYNDTIRVCPGGDEKLEMSVTVNCMGPFLLTNLLLDDLKAAARERGRPSRIVNVSSSLTIHKRQSQNRFDIDDIMLEKSYINGMQAYRVSKCALNLWSNELAKKVEPEEVIINTLCPGFIPATSLGRNSNIGVVGGLVFKLLGTALGRFVTGSVTVETGRDRILRLAFDENINNSGKFYYKDVPTDEAPEVADPEYQAKIWEICERYTGLKTEQ